MKRTIIFASLSFLISLSTTAQVNFVKGTWEDVLSSAKKEQKLVFVDAYTDWCGPCKMMNRNTFPNEEVGEFFASNFVSYKFDMEKGEGPQFASEYAVAAYPTLLFIDYKGKVVMRHSGYLGPREILMFAKEALNPDKNQSNLELSVAQGTASPEDIRFYALNLARGEKDFSEAAASYFKTQEDKDLLMDVNWEAMQMLTQEIESREFQYVLEKKKKFVKTFGEKAVDKKIIEVCASQVELAAEEKDETRFMIAFETAKQHIEDGGESSKQLEMMYKELTEDWPGYAQSAIVYFDKYTITNAGQLTAAANIFLQNIEAEKWLEQATRWAQQATVIENSAENHALYAQLLHKIDQPKTALQHAYQAMRMQEERGEDTQDMMNLIDEIRMGSR